MVRDSYHGHGTLLRVFKAFGSKIQQSPPPLFFVRHILSFLILLWTYQAHFYAHFQLLSFKKGAELWSEIVIMVMVLCPGYLMPLGPRYSNLYPLPSFLFRNVLPLLILLLI